MSAAFTHDHPDILQLEADVLDARPGAILVERSPFFPGGGGQLADRGILRWSGGEPPVTGLARDERGLWHLVPGDSEISGKVMLEVEPAFRALMCELHTLAHVVNALVYTRFGGALLTGAQLNDDGTFRVDFDLPGADNEALRALEAPLNDIIRQDLPVSAAFMAHTEAQAIPGLFRSKAVAPPVGPDGLVRIVEILGLDRQACGGTHLASTGQSRPARIVKIDNKGRQNRRIKVAV
ncbi:alanyl-tRNA editing protein [Bradyrhizobium sp. NAS96.2]|uniref:alanyl-tRNA editing protein n=1 Tax=Bradyrhizobium sp. NAS96.2 TaxID=1680160 RepID=UPI00093E45D1|nr:alanyl-tRNA editing protein [Bradyrhizobium sp. NAS96.2]OKO75832.1 alanyl-tRNA synthetase [Bradyrhizobium sp. NAS96.2]